MFLIIILLLQRPKHALTNSNRKINESTVDYIASFVKDFAAKAKQKQWNLENKVKKSECQLKTLAIDAKTREQVVFTAETIE